MNEHVFPTQNEDFPLPYWFTGDRFRGCIFFKFSVFKVIFKKLDTWAFIEEASCQLPLFLSTWWFIHNSFGIYSRDSRDSGLAVWRQ